MSRILIVSLDTTKILDIARNKYQEPNSVQCQGTGYSTGTHPTRSEHLSPGSPQYSEAEQLFLSFPCPISSSPALSPPQGFCLLKAVFPATDLNVNYQDLCVTAQSVKTVNSLVWDEQNLLHRLG